MNIQSPQQGSTVPGFVDKSRTSATSAFGKKFWQRAKIHFESRFSSCASISSRFFSKGLPERSAKCLPGQKQAFSNREKMESIGQTLEEKTAVYRDKYKTDITPQNVDSVITDVETSLRKASADQVSQIEEQLHTLQEIKCLQSHSLEGVKKDCLDSINEWGHVALNLEWSKAQKDITVSLLSKLSEKIEHTDNIADTLQLEKSARKILLKLAQKPKNPLSRKSGYVYPGSKGVALAHAEILGAREIKPVVGHMVHKNDLVTFSLTSLHGNTVVSSEAVTASQMVSAYKSEVKCGRETVAFFRHGVCVPFGIKDSSERKEGAKQRVSELLTAIFPDNTASPDGQSRCYVDINLETPTQLGTLSGKSSGSNEQFHILEQEAAFEEVGREKKAKVICLCLPINDLSATVLSNQKMQDSLMKKNMSDLFGDGFAEGTHSVIEGIIGEKLESTDPQKQGTAIALAKKIQTLYKHRATPEDNMYLAACIIQLCNAVNIPVGGGCKSGKDRTGLLSTIQQLVAVKVATEGVSSLPEKLDALSESDQNLLREIEFRNGNEAVQRNATGTRGQKPVRAFMEEKILGRLSVFHYGAHLPGALLKQAARLIS